MVFSLAWSREGYTVYFLAQLSLNPFHFISIKDISFSRKAEELVGFSQLELPAGEKFESFS